MRSVYFGLIAAFVGCGAPLAAARADDQPLQGTFSVDPVALIRDGQKLAGKENLDARHEGYKYLFATEENREAFQKEPDKFAIQLGGACARMGPLSGLGQPEIYAVHDGKLYIFASEECRAGFLKDPESLLESGDAVPTGDDEAKKRGKALIDGAVAAIGGPAVLQSMNNYFELAKGTTGSGDQQQFRMESITVFFPDKARTDSVWNDQIYTAVATPDDAFFQKNDEVRTMWPAQRAAFEREVRRNLIVILKARERPDFVAVAQGRAEVDGNAVEQVAVAFGGATSVLGIDPKTGRVLSQTFRGRGAGARLGTFQRLYRDYRTLGSMTLPNTIVTTFEGKPYGDTRPTLSQIGVNARIGGGQFKRP